MPKSDSYGRALEYIIVSTIMVSVPKGNLEVSSRLLRDQRRDRVKFLGLEDKDKQLYKKYALAVYKWLDDSFNISSNKIKIDRLPDSAAIKGDVTDIRITKNNKDINLSVKHIHDALKHQRPPTTAVRCGYAKGSKEDIDFRRKLELINNNFLNKASKLLPKATMFNELKTKDNSFIDKNLYLPICQLVSDFINNNCSKVGNAQELFAFLVGNTNFYKIRAVGDKIEVQEFAEIEKPRLVKASVKNSSYVILVFSNKWQISMRIHTASSRIGTSVKFDTKQENAIISKEIINI